jgi:hypothetical protein
VPPKSNMILDLDVHRAAKLLIDQHGNRAVVHAIGRANFLLEQDDFEGAAVWGTILRAIEELQRAREPDEAVN